MKKKQYKTPKGASFRTFYHGNRKTNGCSFRRVSNKETGHGSGKKGKTEVAE